MTNDKDKKPGFAMPPRAGGGAPPSVETFIAGAVRGDAVAKAQQNEAKPAKTEADIEDLDHKQRIPRQPLRLTAREQKVLEVVVGQGGYRSVHEYVLRAAQRQLESDYQRITGNKVVLGPED